MKFFIAVLRGDIKHQDGIDALKVSRDWWRYHFRKFKDSQIRPYLNGQIGRHRAIHPDFEKEIIDKVNKRSFAGIGFSCDRQFTRFIAPYLVASKAKYTGLEKPIINIQHSTIRKLC